MNKMRVLLILLCAVMCSCQSYRVGRALDRAEQQMISSPDSALTVIRSICKPLSLRSSARARYGLLYSQALDKCYIDITSDSLIRYSVDYYELHGTPEQRMKSLYYLGRVQENGKDYLSATLSYLDAEQYADDVEDNYLKGLLYSNLGYLYYRNHSYPKALEYYAKAYDYYDSEGLVKHKAFNLYSRGFIYGNMRRLEQSEEYLLRAKEMSEGCNYGHLTTLCNIGLIKLYAIADKNREAYDIVKELDTKEYIDNIHALSFAIMATYKSGDKERAKELIDSGWQHAKSRQDTIYMHYCLSQIHYFDKQYKRAFDEYLNWIGSEYYSVVSAMEGYDIASAESLLLESKTKAVNDRMARTKFWVVILAVVLMAFGVVAVVVTIYVRRRHKRRLEQMSGVVVEYAETIRELKGRIYDQSQSDFSLNSENLKNQIDIVDTLCATYYAHAGASKQQEIVFKKVSALIDEIRVGGEYFALVEQVTNRYRNNILDRLKADLPTITAEEYKLACFLCAGFSNQAICLFLNCTKDSIYRRSYRLREKLKRVESPSKEEYLVFI